MMVFSFCLDVCVSLFSLYVQYDSLSIVYMSIIYVVRVILCICLFSFFTYPFYSPLSLYLPLSIFVCTYISSPCPPTVPTEPLLSSSYPSPPHHNLQSPPAPNPHSQFSHPPSPALPPPLLVSSWTAVLPRVQLLEQQLLLCLPLTLAINQSSSTDLLEQTHQPSM